MKCIVAILTVSLSICVYGQKKISFESSSEIIEKGIKNYENKEFEEAIDEFKKVNINDTNYAAAQYEMALSYVGLEKYVNAQQILKELLEYKIQFNFKQKVYMMLGNAYDLDKKPEDALRVYTEGLKIYPYQHNLLYNRGLCYEVQKKYKEALADYQAAIQGNMYHANSHLRLGVMAANQGLYDQALLSMMTFLWLDPGDSRAASVVTLLEQISNGTYEPEADKFEIYPDGDPYAEYNEYFVNRIALQSNYKAKFTVNSDYGKQLHLFLKNNVYQPDNYDFWNQHYMPFFESIWKEKKLDLLLMVSVISLENESIQSKIKSKIPKLKDFYTWSKAEFTKVIAKQYMEFEGTKQFINVDYSVDGLNAMGKMGGDNGITPIGNYYYYHPNGLLKMKAHLNDKGEAIGLWEIYNEFDGNIARKVDFISPTEKMQYFYYFTGELEYKYVIKNDMAQDTVTTYYRNGLVKEKYVLKDAVKNGPYWQYYPNGSLNVEMNYKNGLSDGPYLIYHPNGELADKFTIVQDKIQGPRVKYYPNKQIESEYNFVDDLYDGPYTEYYADGKIQETGAYKKGNQVGEIKEYFSNGNVQSVMTLDESGKQNGNSVFYDLDGKKFHEFEFSKGDLKKIHFTDKNGVSSEIASVKGKKIPFIRNYPSGKPEMKGEIVSDKKEGKWEYFDQYSNCWKVENYKEGVLTDSIIVYHSNGKPSKKFQISKGQKNGLYTQYNIYGDLISEGRYIEDELQDQWYSYNFDGELEAENYYLKGTKHGYQKDYCVNGKIFSVEELDYGRVISNIFLDSNGLIINNLGEYNGDITLRSTNNTFDRFKASYKNGNADGKFRWFGPDNKLVCEGSYVNDNRTGKWFWYHLNGKISKELEYVNGSEHGKENFYFENGQLSSSFTYIGGEMQGEFCNYYPSGKVYLKGSQLDDERHGKAITYGPKGEVAMIRYYNLGVIESYSYLNAEGQELKPIPLEGNEMNIVCYYKNGKKSIEHKRINGLIEGPYISYHENGQKSEESMYLYGEENGKNIEYDEKGVKTVEIDFKKGFKHGFEIEYYPNGKMKSKKPYLYGELHGQALFYNAEGKLIQQITYYDDNPIAISAM